jgi:hypothetical protein
MPTVMNKLREASTGLVYISEGDFPFQPLYWPKELTQGKGLDPDGIRSLAGIEPKAPAQTQSLEDFFRPLTEMEPWYEEDDRKLAQRYQRLVEVVNEEFSDPTVIKFGTLHKEVFVVGRDSEGGIGGLRTRAVES